MRTGVAFIKKEITEQVRSGKLVFLVIVFTALGIMNPAVAKLTPWILEVMADSLAESGMTVGDVTVTAFDSWVQFFKNFPIGLIAFTLLQSSIFTKEYVSGSLILSFTKGMKRSTAVISKALTLSGLWTVIYFLYFAITYGYTVSFWDNSSVENLAFSVICLWLFGLTVISLTVLFSTVFTSNTSVLCGVGLTVLASYLLGLLPKCAKYLPTQLTDGNSLIYGAKAVSEYIPAVIISTVITLSCLIISIPLMNKKQL